MRLACFWVIIFGIGESFENDDLVTNVMLKECVELYCKCIHLASASFTLHVLGLRFRIRSVLNYINVNVMNRKKH